jgi:hypothetical protein
MGKEREAFALVEEICRTAALAEQYSEEIGRKNKALQAEAAQLETKLDDLRATWSDEDAEKRRALAEAQVRVEAANKEAGHVVSAAKAEAERSVANMLAEAQGKVNNIEADVKAKAAVLEQLNADYDQAKGLYAELLKRMGVSNG